MLSGGVDKKTEAAGGGGALNESVFSGCLNCSHNIDMQMSHPRGSGRKMRSGVDGAVLACENGVRHRPSSGQDSSSSSMMSVGSLWLFALAAQADQAEGMMLKDMVQCNYY